MKNKTIPFYVLIIIFVLIVVACGENGRESVNAQSSGIESTNAIVKTGVVCDKLDLYAEYKDGVIMFSVASDLPEDTLVSIEVKRKFEVNPPTGTQSSNMRQSPQVEKMDVSYGESSIAIRDMPKMNLLKLDHERWKNNAMAIMEAFAVANSNTKHYVKSIDDKVIIRLEVAYRQTNPVFGDHNQYLTGKMVKLSENPLFEEPLRDVAVEREVVYPLDTATKDMLLARTWEFNYHDFGKQFKEVENIPVGTFYKISDGRMAIFSKLYSTKNKTEHAAYREVLELFADQQFLPTGSLIRILDKNVDGGKVTDYYVEAKLPNSQKCRGWVGLIGFYACQLERVGK